MSRGGRGVEGLPGGRNSANRASDCHNRDWPISAGNQREPATVIELSWKCHEERWSGLERVAADLSPVRPARPMIQRTVRLPETNSATGKGGGLLTGGGLIRTMAGRRSPS